MNRKKRLAILNCFRKSNPDPKAEILYSSPFELLIAVVLSAQATDIGVNKATSNLYKIANTPSLMLHIGIDMVRSHIKELGLSNNKARYVIDISRVLQDEHNGQVPKTREELERLPGVGRKTANIVLNTIFGLPTIAVDTHVFRVCNRTRFAAGKSVMEVEKCLIKTVPMKFKPKCHYWFLLHGRYICKARKPLCNSCIIEHLCEFDNKSK